MKKYRNSALNHRSTPEQLNQLMSISSPVGWAWLTGIWLVLLAVIGWGIWGEVETSVLGEGVILPAEGFRSVSATMAGHVQAIRVSDQEFVKRGQVLVEIGELGEVDGPGPVGARNPSWVQILAPDDGRVAQIDVSKGDRVIDGQQLMTLFPGRTDPELMALVYMSQVDGLKLRPGMRALVSPVNVNHGKYGAILGEVTRISAVPASEERIQKALNNALLTRKFAKLDAPIEVWVRLQRSPDTPSGFKWSLARGPAMAIPQTCLCKTRVILWRQAPINLVFPSHGSLFGESDE